MAEHNQPWEVGSEFHWMGLGEEPSVSWPTPHTWFALGRDALISIWKMNARTSLQSRLWVPDFFCPRVVRSWREGGIAVRRYGDDPTREEPEWGSLEAAAGDVVLAVNFFGVRESCGWRNWQRENRSVLLIEDHTHDPLSAWARRSEADYAFASLRKTLPVTDGAIAWSPVGRTLPPAPRNDDWSGSALKLAGMIWKREYLGGGTGATSTKETFRTFQTDGEARLEQGRNLKITPWSRAFLERGCPLRWRQQRERNVRSFLDRLGGGFGATPLFRDWPELHCPFNAVLLFPSESARNEARGKLIAENIYPPVHWQLESDASSPAAEISRRILTIPADQRYDENDMRLVARVIENGRTRLAG